MLGSLEPSLNVLHQLPREFLPFKEPRGLKQKHDSGIEVDRTEVLGDYRLFTANDYESAGFAGPVLQPNPLLDKMSRDRHHRERPTGNPWLAVQSAFRAEGKAPALNARATSMVSDAPHDPRTHTQTHTRTTGTASGQPVVPPPLAKR